MTLVRCIAREASCIRSKRVGVQLNIIIILHVTRMKCKYLLCQQCIIFFIILSVKNLLICFVINYPFLKWYCLYIVFVSAEQIWCKINEIMIQASSLHLVFGYYSEIPQHPILLISFKPSNSLSPSKC